MLPKACPDASLFLLPAEAVRNCVQRMPLRHFLAGPASVRTNYQTFGKVEGIIEIGRRHTYCSAPSLASNLRNFPMGPDRLRERYFAEERHFAEERDFASV